MSAASAIDERRRHRRLGLQLTVRSVQGLSWAMPPRTSDISSGGMFFVADTAKSPSVGQELQFELTLPPGEGYWPRTSSILGRGQVVRVAEMPNGRQGVAIKFVQPLSLGLT